MSRKAPIPHALQMRELKYGSRPEEERDRVAEALRAQGRNAEAILLFEGRPEHPFLEEERRRAREDGAAFHLLSLRRMGVSVSDDDLRACGEAAEIRGRWMDARQCWAALEDAAGLARVAPHLPAGLHPEEPEDEAEPDDEKPGSA